MLSGCLILPLSAAAALPRRQGRCLAFRSVRPTTMGNWFRFRIGGWAILVWNRKISNSRLYLKLPTSGGETCLQTDYITAVAAAVAASFGKAISPVVSSSASFCNGYFRL